MCPFLYPGLSLPSQDGSRFLLKADVQCDVARNFIGPMSNLDDFVPAL
jgi:hypothetical protein